MRHGLIDRPLRQCETRGDIAEHHAHAGADADPRDEVGRCELAVGGRQIADDALGFVRGRLAFLSIEVDE